MLTAKVESIDRDVQVLLDGTLSPAAQSTMLADAARDQLAQASSTNESILGRVPPYTTTVDGSRGASEDRVRPDGIIAYEFQLLFDLFKEIAGMLEQASPVGGGSDPHPGLYQKSFTFYADGAEIDVGGEIPPDASEYVFLNTTPYNRKIEQGESPQAPEGVFEAVAALARQRFGNMARISFAYRAPFEGQLLTGLAGNRSDNRVPAISIVVK